MGLLYYYTINWTSTYFFPAQRGTIYPLVGLGLWLKHHSVGRTATPGIDSQNESQRIQKPAICGPLRNNATPCESKNLHRLGRTGLEPDSVTICKSKHLQNSPESGGAESGADSTETDPKAPPLDAADTTRLAVIADLLADLPEAERCEVIAELAPTERVEIARLLIARGSSK